MPARRFRLLVSVLGGVTLLLAVGWLSRPLSARDLTESERLCTGAWCFTEPDAPDTLFVYRFREGGRAVEEHYYLTSATPSVPRLKMHGVWRIDDDRWLVVEQAAGIGGVATEVSRRLRSLSGDRTSSHRILRRQHKLVSAEPDRLAFRVSRRTEPGEHREVELVMVPFDEALLSKP